MTTAHTTIENTVASPAANDTPVPTAKAQLIAALQDAQRDAGHKANATLTLARLSAEALTKKLRAIEAELEAREQAVLNELERQEATAAKMEEPTDAPAEAPNDDEELDEETEETDKVEELDETDKIKEQVPTAAPTAALPAPKAAPVNTPVQRGGGHELFGLNDVITFLKTRSQRRPDSGSAQRFSFIKSGMTVRAFMAAVETGSGSKKRARRTLRKALRLGEIRIDPPIRQAA